MKIDVKIYDVHIISKNLKSCDGFGNLKEVQNIITNESDFYYYYIDHYYCKSTEEFINFLAFVGIRATKSFSCFIWPKWRKVNISYISLYFFVIFNSR